MNRVQRLSRVLRRYASGLFGLSIVILIFSPGLVFLDGMVLDAANHLLRIADVDGVRFSAVHAVGVLRILVWASMAISFITAILSFGALIRLLHQFEAGTAISLESVRLVRFLDWIQVAEAPAGILLFWGLAAVTKALTGQAIHPWKFALGNSEHGLFFGGVTLLVAYVLEEGFRLKSEQELVI